MQTFAILTVTSNDKPGIVEAIATKVTEHQGNWLESSMAQLAGKFVGVVRISLPQTQCEPLIVQLQQLSSRGITISFDIESVNNKSASQLTAKFHAVGPDRTGIVKELSTAFAKHNINVNELETTLSSMPYSGDPLFEANGEVSLPDDTALNDIYERLDDIANDLGIDISIRMNNQENNVEDRVSV